MLKFIAHKTEAFNACCDLSHNSLGNPVKEACFDMQISVVEFLTFAIRCIRGDLDNEDHGKLSPHRLLIDDI